ncbi:hypothetical protein VII00023_00895 [Vibrio ichthyoenteri ATCC 700023]|uniref:Uncharacterized protein n=1 Tax=Vibrio ichthyoenteri ATCC 700023 TaxID=870968 RepID=F9S230_9VIBR|nr:hypothetical protein [Vibrio ichthyoenteri]EGU40221.1 hypothetical protein VII00023_00895 [Vibrio ichthyoenteri ATCC 700023]
MPLIENKIISPSPKENLGRLSEIIPSILAKDINVVKNTSISPNSKNRGFIVRDFDHPNGLSQQEYLPRIKQFESYVPYGIIANSCVVYAKTGEAQGFNHLGLDMKPYTTEVSKERRSLAASELGGIVLRNQIFTEKAVEKISNGIERYLQAHFKQEPNKTLNAVVKGIGHYFFTNGRLSFGRISEQSLEDLSDLFIWNSILGALKHGTLEQKMSIHDAIGRKVLPALGGEILDRYKALEKTVRQDWFDQERIRGRVKNKNVVEPSFTVGITNNDNVTIVGKLYKSRNRGVDIFKRDIFRQSHSEANKFFDDMDDLNLLFGSGISGTTGSLLQAAEAFGPLEDIEEKKQYMLAIVAYLVGGGMHSFHEVMVVGKKVSIPYDAGSYVKSLPESFKNSAEFSQWNHIYYDISELGATHWRFNEGRLPSHLELVKIDRDSNHMN